jgi:nucleoside phosphorylase
LPHKAAHHRSAVILTALDVETKAVLRHLKPRGEKTIGGTVFYRGKFEDWNIAVAETGAGNTSAAAIAERAIANFRPSVALFVGVAGGVKDVVIGDVVVADKM